MQRLTRRHAFKRILLLALSLYFLIGCTPPAFVKEERVPKEVTESVPKWKHIGNISSETPTVTRVLKKYTRSMSAAVHIIQSNRDKYSNNFYKGLPSGASVYISADAELYINPAGGNAPDTVIIKRKPNPEYTFKKSTYPNPIADDGNIPSIYEEDLKE